MRKRITVFAVSVFTALILALAANAAGLTASAAYDDTHGIVSISVLLDGNDIHGCSFLLTYNRDVSFVSAESGIGAMLTSNGSYAAQTAKISLVSAQPLPTDVPVVLVAFDVSAFSGKTATFTLSQIKTADSHGEKTTLADTVCRADLPTARSSEQPMGKEGIGWHYVESGTSQIGGGAVSAKESEPETPDTPDTPEPVIPPSERQIVLTIGEKAALVFGQTIENDVAPVIVHDRTMLPARFVAENLGAKVEWDEADGGVVTITGESVVIVLHIGRDTATVNGKDIVLDSPPFIENDRTYTPLRFIAEHLGASVEWIEQTQKVVITKA